jgi:hypothetical protein
LESFRLTDRSTQLLLSGLPNPVFLRLRYHTARTVSLEEWQAHEPARYRFTYHYYKHDDVNQNPVSFSETLTIENNRITSITNVRPEQGIGPEEARTLLKTVDQLLSLVEDVRKNSWLTTVSYDPVYLFPRLIEIQPFFASDGNEWGIRHEISDWLILP